MTDILNPQIVPQLSPEETENLLRMINEQIAEKTFKADDPQQLKQMVESLGDTRGMIRLGFAEALGQVGRPAVPFLLDALSHHPNVVVRRASAKTLTLIGDPEAVPTLIHSLLEDEDTVVKGSCVGALARTGEAAVSPLLEILASDEHPESTKGHAAWALAFIGAEAKDILYREITSDSSVVRGAVVAAIAKVAQDQPEEQAFNLLINALKDEDETVRCEAAVALGNLAYQPALGDLVGLLSHEGGETRKSAALALMKIGDRAAYEPLKVALTQEKETGVYKAMELAISQLEKRSEW